MATLQKFKMLATQCAVAAGSPTRSPSASPVIHLRRRKTLRMLLTRDGAGGGSRRLPAPEEFVDRRGSNVDTSEEGNGGRRKLKDLFVSPSPSSSPPLEENGETANRWTGGDCDLIGRRGGVRVFNATLRLRLLRRAWRPVLVTIPE